MNIRISFLTLLMPLFLHAQEVKVVQIPQSDESIEFVLIPAGTLTLGSDSKYAESDEQPRKTIEMPAFWMAKTELPYQVFQIYQDPELDLDADGNARVDAVTRPSPPYEDPTHGMAGENYPAAGMTQLSALQFCRWLSEKTGAFIRLPTEAEWEYACKGGTDTDYYFGKKKKLLKEHAWFDKNSNGSTHPVASLEPNPYGLFDMYGNVTEWTLDQYQSDAYAKLDDMGDGLIWIQPTQLHPRSVRGCHYKQSAAECRSANRIESDLEWKKRDPQIPKSFWWNTDSPFVGFRVMIPASEITTADQTAFWSKVLGG